MTPKPLDILKKGFAKLTQTITKKRDDLNIKLSRQEDISSADEHWLDNEGNTIDEQRILEKLESASDYETEVAQLDDNGKAIMKKLRELAGDVTAWLPRPGIRTYIFLARLPTLLAQSMTSYLALYP